MSKHKKHICDDNCNHPIKRVKALPVLPKVTEPEISFTSTTSTEDITTTIDIQEPKNWIDVATEEVAKQIKTVDDDVVRIEEYVVRINASSNEVAKIECNAILRNCKSKLQSIIRDKEID